MPKGGIILVGGEEQLVKWSCHQLCVWMATILLLFVLSTKNSLKFMSGEETIFSCYVQLTYYHSVWFVRFLS